MKKQSLEYQLGFHIGNYIVCQYLVVLDIDSLQTRNVINVSVDEKNKYEQLNDKWFNTVLFKELNSTDNWKELRLFHNEMIKKYIPEELICYVDYFDVENMSEFKDGLEDSLWNSDLSHYSLNEIVEISEDEKWINQGRIIKLKRVINEKI